MYCSRVQTTSNKALQESLYLLPCLENAVGKCVRKLLSSAVIIMGSIVYDFIPIKLSSQVPCLYLASGQLPQANQQYPNSGDDQLMSQRAKKKRTTEVEILISFSAERK